MTDDEKATSFQHQLDIHKTSFEALKSKLETTEREKIRAADQSDKQDAMDSYLGKRRRCVMRRRHYMTLSSKSRHFITKVVLNGAWRKLSSYLRL
jgi:hypothetical protein